MTLLTDRIAEQLHAAGHTPTSLAAELGLRERTVERWAAGTFEPQARHLLELARSLGTSVGYLVGETDDPTPPTT